MLLRFKIGKNSSRQSGRELLDLLIEFSYLAIVFLIPLWFAYFFPTYNVFELNKIILFRILVLLLLAFTGLKIIFYQANFFYNWRQSPFKQLFKSYFLGPLIFILGLFLTLFFSLNPAQSFYGSYDWQAGWLSFFFNFVWFILLSFNLVSLDNKTLNPGASDSILKRVNRLIIVAVLSGFLVAIYGILQIFNIDFITWANAAWEAGRSTSTFGQPNFLASYLLLIIPFGAYLVYRANSFLKKFFWLMLLLFLLLCLVFTASRGALVAFGVMVISFFAYVLFQSKLARLKKSLIVLAVLAGFVIIFFSMKAFSPERFAASLDFKSGSLAARVNFYQAAGEAIMKRPWTGYGLENGSEVFISYYEPDWGIYGDVSASTAQAHNLILDILITAGAAGLIFFIILYYSFFSLAAVNLKQKRQLPITLAVFIGGAGYLISLLFSFPTSAGEIYFWLIFAVLVAVNYPEKSGLIQVLKPKIVKKWLQGLRVASAAALVVFSGWLIMSQLRILQADFYFNKLYYSLGNGEYLTALVLDDYIQAEGTTPLNREFYDWFLGEQLSNFYPEIKELAPRKLVKDRLAIIRERLLGRGGYRDFMALAKIEASLGNEEIAEKYFSFVVSLTPYWPKVYLTQARSLKKAGNFAAAIRSYHLAAFNLPDLNDPRINERHRTIASWYAASINRDLGDIYSAQNNFSAAEKYYREAYRDNPMDFIVIKKIADTYYLRGDFARAIIYNQQGLRRSPGDYNWYLALAVLYKESGNSAQAEFYFSQALKLAPDSQVLKNMADEYKNN